MHTLNDVVDTLKRMEETISNQIKDVENKMSELTLTDDKMNLLLANIKSLKTSTELLRDEIEEINVVLYLQD